MKACKIISARSTANDAIYTPLYIARLMIDMCDIKTEMNVLDPSRGEGVFYNNLPDCNKEYCEITEGLDFFNYTKRVDLIIGNPPYSLWDKWLAHTMTLTDKFCYIFGVYNFTDKRINEIIEKGYGITKFHLLKVDWWFSPSFIVVFEKNKPSIITVEPKRIYCDICNTGKRCGRGQKDVGMNKCPNDL
jgi:hypothetical protein